MDKVSPEKFQKKYWKVLWEHLEEYRKKRQFSRSATLIRLDEEIIGNNIAGRTGENGKQKNETR